MNACPQARDVLDCLPITAWASEECATAASTMVGKHESHLRTLGISVHWSRKNRE
jgi:hypothetical protein